MGEQWWAEGARIQDSDRSAKLGPTAPWLSQGLHQLQRIGLSNYLQLQGKATSTVSCQAVKGSGLWALSRCQTSEGPRQWHPVSKGSESATEP